MENKLTKKILISFVIPMLNEEACLEKLYSRILPVCRKLKVRYELICINDGSTDETLSVLKKLRLKDKQIKIISFARNFGHQIAVMAGLGYALGDAVAVMDADLQDPPELVTKMVRKWQAGYKVVYGIRKIRQETGLKNIFYKVFYRLLIKVSPIKNIPLDAGDFCLMDKQVVREMRQLHESKPFVRGLRAWVGFRQTGIDYSRPVRLAGESKYDFKKLLFLAADALLSFSSFALQMTIVVGLIISLLSIVYACYIALNRILIFFGFLGSKNLVPGWATLVFSFMFLMGLQFIFLGILGEYISRIYLEVKKRPLYIIEEKIGFKDEESKD